MSWSLYYQFSIMQWMNYQFKPGARSRTCSDRGGSHNEQLHTSRRMYAVGRLASPLRRFCHLVSRIAERLRRSRCSTALAPGLSCAWAQTQCRSDPACLDGLGHVLTWMWFLLAGQAGAGKLEGDDGRPDVELRGLANTSFIGLPMIETLLWPAVYRRQNVLVDQLTTNKRTFRPRHSGRLALCLRAKRKRQSRWSRKIALFPRHFETKNPEGSAPCRLTTQPGLTNS